jgi:hypothetical protein
MNALIETSPNKDFFELLLNYQNSKAAELAKTKISAEIAVGGLMLKLWLKNGNYLSADAVGLLKLDFSKEYAQEIAELGRLIDIYLSDLKQKEAAKPFIADITEYLTASAQHIEKLAKAISAGGKIQANTWMDGASLRDWALYLATYYEDRKDYANEVQMRFVRCKITNSIMNHYMHLVGPDMVGVGRALEKINNPEKAFMFYNAVTLDFTPLLDEFATKKPQEEDKLSLWALKEAYSGLIRIGKSENPDEDKQKVLQIEALIKN